jgi:hypothetical protein
MKVQALAIQWSRLHPRSAEAPFSINRNFIISIDSAFAKAILHAACIFSTQAVEKKVKGVYTHSATG